MVHALQETWRVLRPGGIMIDLRPEIEQSRVGITKNGRFFEIGESNLSLENSYASDQALSKLIQMKLFQPQHASRFLCTLIAPSYKQLRGWIHDPDVADAEQHTAWLVDQIRQAVKACSSPVRIVIRQHIMLQVLEKRLSSMAPAPMQ